MASPTAKPKSLARFVNARIDYIRSRLPANFGSISSFYILAAVFIALIVGVIIGVLHRSSQYHSNPETAGSFFDGLIANGLSVIISTLLIVPLTNLLSSILRERRLAPVRKVFVSNLAREVDRLAVFYVSHLARFKLAVYGLGLNLQVTAASVGMERMVESLRETTEMLARTVRQNVREPSGDVSPMLDKALQGSRTIAMMVRHLYDFLYRESSIIENTLTFAMPIMPLEDVPSLQEFRELIVHSRAFQQDMLAVLAGVDEPGIATRAKQSTMNFFLLNRLIEQMAVSVGLENVSALLTNSAAIEEMDSKNSFQQLTEDLVGLFSESRRADAQWAAMGDERAKF